MHRLTQLPPIVMASLLLMLACCVWVWQQFHHVPTKASAEPMQCVSYSPFYQGSNPLDPNTFIPRAQIEQDLRRLATRFPCVRTYSVAQGLEAVPEIAQQLGLKVYLGIWIGWVDSINRQQIDTAVRLSKQYPKAIKALVVGNEVLLRGEQKPAAMRAYFKEIKQRTQTPITYADVWEFWRQHRDLSQHVDFITVHILPYWENSPVAISHAGEHIQAVMQILQQEFEKPILIGETGWPSAGRQRYGAEPGLRNQAQYFQIFLDLAHTHQWQYNLIEAYDQPWKRVLEGTVGGYWGIFDVDGKAKFTLGAGLAERNDWPLLATLCVIALLSLWLALRIYSPQKPDSTQSITTISMALITGLSTYLQWDYILLACRNYQEWMALTGLSLLALGLSISSIYFILFGQQQYQRSVFSYHARWLILIICLSALCASVLLIVDGRYRNFPNQLLLLPISLYILCTLFSTAPVLNLYRWFARLLAFALTSSAMLLLFNEANNTSAQIWLLLNLMLSFALLRHDKNQSSRL